MSRHVWVLMAQDGGRDCFESWESVAAFDHEPTTLECGRALAAADVPWGGAPWGDADRPRRIMDWCQIIRVPVVGGDA